MNYSQGGVMTPPCVLCHFEHCLLQETALFIYFPDFMQFFVSLWKNQKSYGILLMQ